MTRYIGLDAHSNSSTLAVINERGKRLKHMTVETSGQALIEFIKTVPKERYLCLEEGTQSLWLYEILHPYVDELIVTHQRKIEGNKNDIHDAYKLADDLRLGAIKPVFKDQRQLSQLKSLCSIYTMISQDTVRTQNRIKALFRSRGITTTKMVYSETGRECYMNKLPDIYHASADILYTEYDAVHAVKLQARKHMIEQLNKHRISKILKTCPGMAEIRVAQMMSVIITPYRFRTKRQLWSYSGLGVVMRSSSDWEKSPEGWKRVERPKSRGLNPRYNRILKEIFKGAATTVIAFRQRPLYDDYQKMLEQGTRPPLAKLTIARKIAAIALVMWKNKEEYNPEKYRNKE